MNRSRGTGYVIPIIFIVIVILVVIIAVVAYRNQISTFLSNIFTHIYSRF